MAALEWVWDEASFHNFNVSALMNEAYSVGGVNNMWTTCAVLQLTHTHVAIWLKIMVGFTIVIVNHTSKANRARGGFVASRIFGAVQVFRSTTHPLLSGTPKRPLGFS